MDEILIDGVVYTKNTDGDFLDRLLLQHLRLDFLYNKTVDLTDTQLLTLKSWLLLKTEAEFSRNSYITVSEPIHGEWIDGAVLKTIYGRGKNGKSEVSIWHEPLPWPEGWPDNRLREYDEGDTYFEKRDNGIVMVFRGRDILLGKTAPKKFLDGLKLMISQDPQEVKIRLPNKGLIKMKREKVKSDVLIAFWVSTEDPRYASLIHLQNAEAAMMGAQIESLIE